MWPNGRSELEDGAGSDMEDFEAALVALSEGMESFIKGVSVLADLPFHPAGDGYGTEHRNGIADASKDVAAPEAG